MHGLVFVSVGTVVAHQGAGVGHEPSRRGHDPQVWGRGSFMGELDLTPTQIRVGEILLRKVIPDLTHTDLSTTLTRRYADRSGVTTGTVGQRRLNCYSNRFSTTCY